MKVRSGSVLNQLASTANGRGMVFFTDLDLTSCVEGDKAFADANKDGELMPCYMEPKIRKTFKEAQEVHPGSVFIVT